MRAVVVVAAGLLASCHAAPPADPKIAVRVPSVEIDIRQDAEHRLLVRYRVPAGVEHLDFLQTDPRYDAKFRSAAMKPASACGALVPNGIALHPGPGCDDGALFVVEPRELDTDAMYEPAQPSSDGGVLLYTGYYAATAPGMALRWQFTPSQGEYGVDDSALHDTGWEVVPGLVFDGPKPEGDQRASEKWLAAQHAQHYVFLGHSPVTQAAGLLWVRDPALPASLVNTVGNAGPRAWAAYKRASGQVPDGPAAIVMLGAPGEHVHYHGDRTEGRMIRLSFALAEHTPSPDELEAMSKFVAHETAHLWNHGVFQSDPERPWLHEGDAEWVALVAMHDAHLLSDHTFVSELQARIDACMIVRGENVSASLRPGRSEQDDPYGCGVALQLLGYAQLRARGASGDALGAWAALHRAQHKLDTAGFAAFFDGGSTGAMRSLLLGARTPFASSYRANLSAVLPLRDGFDEPTASASREAIAVRLFAQISGTDCGALGFTLDAAHGRFVLDDGLHCKALPAGARVTTIGGVRPLAQPRAAWRAAQRACATGRIELGIDGGPPVEAACPAKLAELMPQAVLPDDVLARLGIARND